MISNCLPKIKQKELETQIQTMRIFSQDIGVEFSIEKCAMFYNEKQETANDGRNGTA